MKRVKNPDGTITAFMGRNEAFDIVETLLAQIRSDREDIQLTIVDDQYTSALEDILAAE